jgi:sugar lactone lactonase YvrE
MGTQSTTHPPRSKHASLRTALFLLLYVAFPFAQAQTQTQPQTSALAIPLILPSAIVFDATGNLYLAETANHLIRKVDTTGHITTIAGTGAQGFSGDNGPAISATLDSPQGLALDSANNLYLADTHNHRIRKLNLTTGTITTIAGTGTPGFSGDNSPATSTQFNLPTALALDANQNLYVADTANHRVRRIDAATNIITTIAGTGTQGFSGDNTTAASANIDSPTGIVLDTANNLYLADTHNHRIRRIDATTGIITTIAGTGTPGFSGDTASATSATLALPHGLTVDANGNLYLADTANHRIRRIDTTTGIITTIAGDGTQTFAGDGSPAITASLDTPRATAVSPNTFVTLADTGNQRIRQLTADPAPATTIQTIAGLGPATTGTLALTAPSVITYGTGEIAATLATATPATGSITFFDTTSTSTGTATLNTVTLTSNTASLSTATLPAGLHTLTATYSGDQTHPSAQTPAFPLTINPAPSVVTLSNLVATATTGSSITLTARVASTTTGTPAGSIALLDNGSPLSTSPISPAGDAVFIIPSITQGNHSFTALYNGGPNFTSATSTPQLITVGPPPTNPDFTVTPTGTTTQTIVSGSSATYTFSIQLQATMSSPVTLAATGLPNLAAASFNPPTIPPGSTVNTFTLTIVTPNTAAQNTNHHPIKWALLLIPIATLTLRPRNRNIATKILTLTLLTLTLILSNGCGDRISTADALTLSAKPYTITVTGTATTPTGTLLQHSTTVTLLLEQPQ